MNKRCSTEVLRQYAEVFPPFDGLAESSKGREWRIGSLGVWKSGPDGPVMFHGRRVPTYRRGSLVCDLPAGMHFAVGPFTLKDGTAATAVLLRSNDEELIGAWTVDAPGAAHVASFLNAELEALRRALVDDWAPGTDTDDPDGLVQP